MNSKKREFSDCLNIARSLIKSMDKSVEESSTSDIWRYAGYRTYAKEYNKIAHHVSAISTDADIDLFNLDKLPDFGDTIPIQQKAYYDSVHLKTSVLIAYLENNIGYAQDQILQLRDFIQANLRRATLETPKIEKEVQDNIERILIGRGLHKGSDYDREVGRVKIAHKETIPDFIFPPLNLAMEVKLSKNETKSKVIVDEINADIQAYSKGYDFILFVIYDLGSIRDVDEFSSDIQQNKGIFVEIIKH
ncbi:hypothetical protein GUA87_14290 [Sneathiella sp. P13V-1]|uniref:PD-(D/E)XK nuclease domain-containing protein n=1 Tax=Sneathiella sp. P13V-1 TaxID=2697366 RepID=UPI00187B57F0|nr:hypothetical protein [Sneathiella sp. P13V-1]MBE7638023.1 hypothetical protein [Sneathiella sp. P13V-1]